jgi:hypothetical protein
LSFGGNCEARIGLDEDVVLRGSGVEEEVEVEVVVVKIVRSIV